MNFVQPIRDVQVLVNIQEHLKEQSPRDYILLLLGIYTGLRISDILRLKVKDLKDKTYLDLREKKTKKQIKRRIHPYLKQDLKIYLQEMDPEEYVIKSRVGKNKPITRKRAYDILQKVAAEFNLDSIGTHTLRKTFGYHFYKQTGDVALLQEIFNHASPSITLRYIGINQDTMDQAITKFRYHL